MLVLPGVEISKNYLSSDRSAHLLLLTSRSSSGLHGVREHLPGSKEAGCARGGMPPHTTPNMTEKDTLFLWNNRDRYAKYIDAWEIANATDVFNVVSLKRYPYIANSDFHKARHLYSWKTLLNCEKSSMR